MRRRLLALCLAVAAPALAQTWNSNAGGYNTGYGTVYGSAGLGMATQNLYLTLQMNAQRAAARQAMVDRFGRAAVEKAERDAARGKPLAATGPQVTAPPKPPRNLGAFKPDARLDLGATMAEGLGGTPEEKQLIKAIFQGTRQAFEAQKETRTWKNNVAGALAFFIIGNVSIFQGAEPDDAAAQALFEAVNRTLDETPEFAKASNKDKQQLYELLIGFTGMPLTMAAQAGTQHDEKGAAAAKALAGQLIQLVLKVDPSKLQVKEGALAFAP